MNLDQNPATLVDTVAALKAGDILATELVQASVELIEARDQKLHAFIEVLADDAGQAAKAWDAKRDGNSVLGGIPIGVKDNICTVEGHTTAASNILKDFRSPYEATVISRLKAAGAVIMGKMNLDEFAMGSSTEYSSVGVTHNPWDEARVPGGSSGGSAAAVAAGEVIAALGTDTGGSVRQPASFCGVVGLKPTYGRLSRFGVIAYGSSLDQVGTLTRTVKDGALLLEIMAGQDERDATTSPTPVPQYTKACGTDMRGLRIGVPKEFFGEGVDGAVVATVKKAIAELEQLGAHIVDISLPLTPAAVAVYFLIAKAEASSNLARYDGIRWGKFAITAEDLIGYYNEVRGQGFGEEVKRAILMGTYVLSAGYADAWYKQASKVRTLIQREYEQAWQHVDAIACPVAPEVAFPIGSRADDPLAMYLSDALTVPINIAGIPAISVPCGFVNGLPVGLQLLAPHWHEETLFTIGHAYEQSQEWRKRVPRL